MSKVQNQIVPANIFLYEKQPQQQMFQKLNRWLLYETI
jgi:hypothetical protein